MEQGGVVMSISDVSLSVASDSGSSKSELIKNQDLNTLILSELFSDMTRLILSLNAFWNPVSKLWDFWDHLLKKRITYNL